MRRRIAALAALLALTACSDSGSPLVLPSGSAASPSGSSSPASSSSASSSSASAASSSSLSVSSFPSSSSTSVTTTIPPFTGSTTTTVAPPPPVQNATHDITDVRYSKPSGFKYGGSNYRLNNPGESSYTARFLVPKGSTPGSNLDVVALVLYRLPSVVSVTTPADQLARLKYYNRRAGAVTQDKIERTTVAGYPALQENAVEQGPSQTYRYAAWFVFGSRHVLLVTCQVDKKVNRVAQACQTVLDSMRLS